MKVPGSMYFNILQDCLSQLKETLKGQIPGVQVDLNLTITKQEMNMYELNMKQLRQMEGKVPPEMLKEHEKRIEEQYKEDPIQNVLYLRLDRKAIIKEVHIPKDVDFVPGFKYQRLKSGTWKDEIWPEGKDAPKEIDGTYRYVFNRRLNDLLYNNSWQIPKDAKKKHETEARNNLYKAMVYDLMGIGLQVSASEFQQEKMAKEKAMIEQSKNEMESNLRASKGGKASGVQTGPTAEGEVVKGDKPIEQVSKDRIEIEGAIPVDEKYKKEIAKARRKAGIKDGEKGPEA